MARVDTKASKENKDTKATEVTEVNEAKMTEVDKPTVIMFSLSALLGIASKQNTGPLKIGAEYIKSLDAYKEWGMTVDRVAGLVERAEYSADVYKTLVSIVKRFASEQSEDALYIAKYGKFSFVSTGTRGLTKGKSITTELPDYIFNLSNTASIANFENIITEAHEETTPKASGGSSKASKAPEVDLMAKMGQENFADIFAVAAANTKNKAVAELERGQKIKESREANLKAKNSKAKPENIVEPSLD